MKSFLPSGPLRAENDPGGGGGGPAPAATSVPSDPPVVAPPAPDITKLLEQLITPISKSISDLRKEFQEADNRTNTRIKTVIDDLVSAQLEGLTASTSSSVPPVAPVPPAAVPAPAPVASAPPPDDASRLQMVSIGRKLKDAEEAIRQRDVKMLELSQENRRTKIESAVNSAMAKLPWAQGASDMVANQMMQSADLDADGKVKIVGADPSKYIADWHAANPWAQPAPVNAGSGNSGGSPRRVDGSVDLANYNSAKVDPGGDDFKRLIEQTKRQIGMS